MRSVLYLLTALTLLGWHDLAQAQCDVTEVTALDGMTDPGADDRFGRAVAIDGAVAIVGAPREDLDTDPGASDNSGAAYVFRQNLSGDWQFEWRLSAGVVDVGGKFGHSVAIRGDLAVVGAHRSSLGVPFEAGRVFVFRRVGQTWQEEQILTGSSPQALGYFGDSVAIGGPDVIVVGATFEQDPSTLVDSGAAYVFRYVQGQWILETRLTSLVGGTMPDDDDRFGRSVSVDGDVVLIGAPREDYDQAPPSDDNSGAAYVFRYVSGMWEFQERLSAMELDVAGFLGHAVAVQGEVAVVAAHVSSLGVPFQAGRALVFRFNGLTWDQEQILSAGDAAPGDFFGESVSIGGETIAIGANGKDQETPFLEDAGAAYVFSLEDDQWQETEKLTAGGGVGAFNSFGISTGVSSDVVLVGELFADTASFNAGSALFFEFACAADFTRGDGDGDGTFNGLPDGIYILAHQFSGGPPPPCMEAGDADGDGVFNGLTDGFTVLAHQFQGGPPPPSPYPACGSDPDPGSSLGCDSSPCP